MHSISKIHSCKKLHQVFDCTLLFKFLCLGVLYANAYSAEKERAVILETGYLGASALTVEKEGITNAQVIMVWTGSPAEKAGLMVNDIILDINGVAISDNSSYLVYMGNTKIGQKIKITILRDGKKKKISVVLTSPPLDVLQSRLKKRLGQSLLDKGEEALAKRELDKAIESYKLWLEADPQDKGAWYNLACAYALKGNKEKALETFECAIDAGWDDPQQPKQDSSLALIWGEERFKTSLDQCARITAFDEPVGYTRHFIKMASLGTYVVMLPPDYEKSDKQYPLCLILHGHGSTETRHGRIADNIGREGVIYIAPRAAYPNTEVFLYMKQPGWTAWPPYDFGADTLSYFETLDRLSVDWIFACAEDAKQRYRVEGDRVFIIGHSQGAELANVCAALYPDRIASYFAYAGFMPEAYLSKEFLEGIKKNNVKVYLAHGTKDKTVDPEESIKIDKAMKEAGVNCTLKLFTAEHVFTGDVYSFAEEWLNIEILGKKGND